MTPKTFLDIGMGQVGGEGSGFFVNNRLVKVCMGLDNFNLASESEKNALLRLVVSSRSRLGAVVAHRSAGH
jgi:SCY1-like protein 1